MSDRPTIPEVFDAFADYHGREPVWGALHVVLEDGNHADHAVEHCIEWAHEGGDAEGEHLGRILLRMTPTQRGKLASRVSEYERTGKKPGWPTPRSNAVNPTEQAFLADIIANPDDDTPRLIFADWLQENGHEERAEFVRVQCELAQPWVCSLVDATQTQPCLVYNASKVKKYRVAATCAACRRVQHLEERQYTLYHAHRDRWGDLLRFVDTLDWWRRGFIEKVVCTATDWLIHHAAIRAATPLREVQLTTCPGFAWSVERLPGDLHEDRDNNCWRYRRRAIVRWGDLPRFTIHHTSDIPYTLLNDRSFEIDAVPRREEAAFEALLQQEHVLNAAHGWFPGVKITLPPVTSWQTNRTPLDDWRQMIAGEDIHEGDVLVFNADGTARRARSGELAEAVARRNSAGTVMVQPLLPPIVDL